MTKHYVVTLVVLALTAWAHVALTSAQAEAGMRKPPEDVLQIPEKIGPYVRYGTDPEVSDRVKEVLETSLIVQRVYTSPQGLPIQLSIVYAGASRRSLHFPQVCIVGAGYQIREQTTMPIGFQFEATRLELVKGEDRQAVVYWFKTGDRFTGDYFRNSWYWATEQMTFGAPTSAMIKLSANLHPGSEDVIYSILEDFATKLAPVLLENVK